MKFIDGLRAWLSGSVQADDLTVEQTEQAPEPTPETEQTEPETAPEQVAEMAALQAQVQEAEARAAEIAAQLATERAEVEQAERLRWVDAQVQAGRLVPAMRENAMAVLATDGADAFKAMVESAPAMVDLTEKGFDNAESPIPIKSKSEWNAADGAQRDEAVRAYMKAYDIADYQQAATKLAASFKEKTDA